MKDIQMIIDENQVHDLKDMGCHYNPKLYLSKYHFSKEVLLNVFCSEGMVWTCEDYYGDDIDMQMIHQYQPHIDIDEFRILWNDLDEVRRAEYHCHYVKDYPRLKSDYHYNIIDCIIQFYTPSTQVEQIISDFKMSMKVNRYIQLYYSIEKIDTIVDLRSMKKIADEILEGIPAHYSDILPLHSKKYDMLEIDSMDEVSSTAFPQSNL